MTQGNASQPETACEPADTVELTGGEALIRMAANLGVRDVFGLASGKLTPIFAALAKEPRLRYLGVRHEASAAFMAAGVAAASGRMALALGETAGGGLNLASATGVAFANNLPLLAVTSDHVQALSAPWRGAFSSGDNVGAFKTVTKANVRIADARRIPEIVRWAFREALSGRPGPVHLDIPADVLGQRSLYPLVELDAPLASFLPVGRTRADPGEVERAARLLLAAERPLLIAGGGAVASGAVEIFRKLTKRLGALAIPTQMGLGAVSSADPLFIGQGGIIGGEAVLKALREADVVLAVGCRFSSWMWPDGAPQWRDGARRKLIHLDIDPAIVGVNAPAEVALIGDAAAVLEQLSAALGGPDKPLSDWSRAVLDARRTYRARIDALADSRGPVMHPAALARAVGDFIGEGGRVMFDGGHTTFWSNEATPTASPRTRFHEPGMSQLGFGTPYALAIKQLYPDEPVFQITGDGAFGFTLQELDTARRAGLNIITIIHNNASFGVIGFAQGHSQFRFGVELQGTDYAAIARGFGCFGEVVTTPEEVGPALRRAVESNLPAVIDARVSFDPHPMLPVFGRSSSVPRD